MLAVAHALKIYLQRVRLALLTRMLALGDHFFDEIMEGSSVWDERHGVSGPEYKDRSSLRRYRPLAPLSEYELRRFVSEDDTFPDVP